MITSLLLLSVLLQIFAAIMALRLIRFAKRKTAWVLLSTGLTLMAFRRVVEIIPILFNTDCDEFSLLNNWLAIFISIIISIAVILLSDFFYSIKMSEKEHFVSVKKFETVFNSSSDEIYLMDLRGKIIEVNQTICDVLNFARDELLSMHLKDLKSARFKDKVESNLEKIINQKVLIFESEHQTKDGKIIPVEIKSKVIDFQNEKAILSIARDLSERKQIERKILNAVIETEEKNKEQFAKDLHDDLGSLLSTISIYINLIRSEETNEKEKKDLIASAEDLMDQAIDRSKEIANNLRPNIISQFGLAASIKSFCDKISSTGLINISFASDIKDGLSKDVEVTLFRICKELINNTLKHASADSIKLSLKSDQQFLFLQYADNGKGFNVDKIMQQENKPGMGLANINSRVKALNGVFKIESSPKGTSVNIKVVL